MIEMYQTLTRLQTEYGAKGDGMMHLSTHNNIVYDPVVLSGTFLDGSEWKIYVLSQRFAAERTFSNGSSSVFYLGKMLLDTIDYKDELLLAMKDVILIYESQERFQNETKKLQDMSVTELMQQNKSE